MGAGVTIGRALRGKLGRGRPLWGLIPDEPNDLTLERITERLCLGAGCQHHRYRADWCAYCHDRPLYIWDDLAL